MSVNSQKYTRGHTYTERGFWNKLSKFAKVIGRKLVTRSLELYYVTKESGAPKKAKSVIAGALLYLILPADAIPDVVPVAGYADDGGVIATTMILVKQYVTPRIAVLAKQKAKQLLGS